MKLQTAQQQPQTNFQGPQMHLKDHENITFVDNLQSSTFGEIQVFRMHPYVKYLGCKAKIKQKHPNIFYMPKIEQHGNHQMKVYFEYKYPTVAQHIAQRLEKKYLYPEFELWIFIKQMISAFKFLQDNNTWHGDIDAHNIFYDDEYLMYRIYDNAFINNPYDGFKKMTQGTNSYISPELTQTIIMKEQLHTGYNFYKADVFSLGMVLLEIGSFQSSSKCYCNKTQALDFERINQHIHILAKRQDNKAIICQRYSPLLVGFLQRLLEVDYRKRLDWNELNTLLSEETIAQCIKTALQQNMQWIKQQEHLRKDYQVIQQQLIQQEVTVQTVVPKKTYQLQDQKYLQMAFINDPRSTPQSKQSYSQINFNISQSNSKQNLISQPQGQNYSDNYDQLQTNKQSQVKVQCPLMQQSQQIQPQQPLGQQGISQMKQSQQIQTVQGKLQPQPPQVQKAQLQQMVAPLQNIEQSIHLQPQSVQRLQDQSVKQQYQQQKYQLSQQQPQQQSSPQPQTQQQQLKVKPQQLNDQPPIQQQPQKAQQHQQVQPHQQEIQPQSQQNYQPSQQDLPQEQQQIQPQQQYNNFQKQPQLQVQPSQNNHQQALYPQNQQTSSQQIQNTPQLQQLNQPIPINQQLQLQSQQEIQGNLGQNGQFNKELQQSIQMQGNQQSQEQKQREQLLFLQQQLRMENLQKSQIIGNPRSPGKQQKSNNNKVVFQNLESQLKENALKQSQHLTNLAQIDPQSDKKQQYVFEGMNRSISKNAFDNQFKKFMSSSQMLDRENFQNQLKESRQTNTMYSSQIFAPNNKQSESLTQQQQYNISGVENKPQQQKGLGLMNDLANKAKNLQMNPNQFNQNQRPAQQNQNNMQYQQQKQQKLFQNYPQQDQKINFQQDMNQTLQMLNKKIQDTLAMSSQTISANRRASIMPIPNQMKQQQFR